MFLQGVLPALVASQRFRHALRASSSLCVWFASNSAGRWQLTWMCSLTRPIHGVLRGCCLVCDSALQRKLFEHFSCRVCVCVVLSPRMQVIVIQTYAAVEAQKELGSSVLVQCLAVELCRKTQVNYFLSTRQFPFLRLSRDYCFWTLTIFNIL